MNSAKIYLKIITGCQAGQKYLLNEGATTIGREANNTINFPETEKIISGYHAIIYKSSDCILIQDLQSTNGTFVNESRINETELFPGDKIGLGRYGPRFLVTAFEENSDLNEDQNKVSPPLHSKSSSEEFTSNMIDQSDQDFYYCKHTISQSQRSDDYKSPATGIFDNIKETIQFKNLKRNFSSLLLYYNLHDKRFEYINYALLAIPILFIVICFFYVNRNYYQKLPENGVLQTTHADSEGRDNKYHTDNPDLTPNTNPIYINQYLHPIAGSIDSILKRLGETNYSIPQNMIDRVNYHIAIYSGQLKPVISRYMQRKNSYFPMICNIFREKKIPVELAYISMLESGFNPEALSQAGARGLWQFIPETAKKYGLTVNKDLDERIDPKKSTFAAAEYLKDLIGIFGGKSSLMLCLAAYNTGEGRIINILRKIDDPLRNRDFWYIYKKGYLSEETKEYIPRIIALMIISENPRKYGFDLVDNFTIESYKEDNEVFDIDYRVK